MAAATAKPLRGADRTTAPCFGVCCERHQRCARYAAVDGAANSRGILGTCRSARSQALPMFVERRAA